jgi:signal transduction histidine kinase
MDRRTVRVPTWPFVPSGVVREVGADARGVDPPATAHGRGLRNVGDRLDAFGGTLEIRSEPGSGTTIPGPIPSREVVTR